MGLMHEGVWWLWRTGLTSPQSVLLPQEREVEGRGGYWWIHGRMILCRQSGFLGGVPGFGSSKEED